MSILGAVIVPHPPLIIPTVGRGREREVQATIDACRTAASRRRPGNRRCSSSPLPTRSCTPTTFISLRARALPETCPPLVRPRPNCVWSIKEIGGRTAPYEHHWTRYQENDGCHFCVPCKAAESCQSTELRGFLQFFLVIWKLLFPISQTASCSSEDIAARSRSPCYLTLNSRSP